LPDQVRTFEAVYEPTSDCGWWDLEVGVGRLFQVEYERTTDCGRWDSKRTAIRLLMG